MKFMILCIFICLCASAFGFILKSKAYSIKNMGSSRTSNLRMMAPLLVPRGMPITIDFKVIAGNKGAEWGELSEEFEQKPGTVLYASVASYPLGCTIEEADDGSAIVFTEVQEGMGGALAGVQKGDRIRALTALVLPRSANLVKEPLGALFTTDPRNLRLFDQTMEAFVSNSPANGGSGKTILVFERDAA